MKNCAVILAGGEGKRMKSDKPKTLSEVLGRPMLCWVMSALRKAGIDDICVVKGFKKECVEEYLSTLDFSVERVFQAERHGADHAVMMAKDFLSIVLLPCTHPLGLVVLLLPIRKCVHW